MAVKEPERPKNKAEASWYLLKNGFKNADQRVKLLSLWERYRRGELR